MTHLPATATGPARKSVGQPRESQRPRPWTDRGTAGTCTGSGPYLRCTQGKLSGTQEVLRFPAHCPAPKVPESEKPRLPPLTGGWGLQAAGWGVFPAVPTFLRAQPEVDSVPVPDSAVPLAASSGGFFSCASPGSGRAFPRVEPGKPTMVAQGQVCFQILACLRASFVKLRNSKSTRESKNNTKMIEYRPQVFQH